jgi:hypothetical protein
VGSYTIAAQPLHVGSIAGNGIFDRRSVTYVAICYIALDRLRLQLLLLVSRIHLIKSSRYIEFNELERMRKWARSTNAVKGRVGWQLIGRHLQNLEIEKSVNVFLVFEAQ